MSATEIHERARRDHSVQNVRRLIDEMGFFERFIDDHYDGPDLHGVGYEAYLVKSQVIDPEPGIDGLQAMADAEGSGFSAAWLRKRRGVLVVGGLPPADVDEMTVAAFADAVIGGTPAAITFDRLNEAEKTILESIAELGGAPTNEEIAGKAGYKPDSVKKATGPMHRHGLLDRGPNGDGYAIAQGVPLGAHRQMPR